MAIPGAKQSTPTPGQQALIEAMRLESARIYGQLQPEHHNDDLQAVEMSVPSLSNVTHLAPRRTERGVA